MVDISDRKQAEEALQDSEEQLRLITDALPVCISYVDKKQRYQFNNKTYEDWFGLSRSELKGRHLKEVLGASAYELIRGAVEEALSGQAVNFEATLPYVGGGERYVVADFIPYVADQGKVMGFFVLATDISERNRVEKALRKSETALRQSRESLRTLAGRLMSAQEDERRRIAQELHDDINQQMAGLVIGIETLEQQLPKSARPLGKTLTELRGQAADLSDQIRHFAHRLHPSILDHLGLVPALKSYCEEFSQQTGVRATFRHREVPSEFPHELALCLYRVAQESLTNTVKHSGAKQARLSLTGTRDLLRLTVTDRGIGFSPEAGGNKRGIGLISMAERVRVLSGSLLVQSQPGGGTRVEACLPLANSNG